MVDEAIEPCRMTNALSSSLISLQRRTHQAIAEDLGISRRTVINRIQRGIEGTGGC